MRFSVCLFVFPIVAFLGVENTVTDAMANDAGVQCRHPASLRHRCLGPTPNPSTLKAPLGLQQATLGFLVLTRCVHSGP